MRHIVKRTAQADEDLMDLWVYIAPELRYLPVGKYLLLYRKIRGGIEIVRVVHGARNIAGLL